MERALRVDVDAKATAAASDLDAGATPFCFAPPTPTPPPPPLPPTKRGFHTKTSPALPAAASATSRAAKLVAAENASLVATLCEQLDDARGRVASLDAAVSRRDARADEELGRYARRCAELSRANQALTAALAERDEETRALRRALAACDVAPRDVAPPSPVEKFSWSDAVEREDALQRAANPPAPARENTLGAGDQRGQPPLPPPPPHALALRPPPPSTPSPPPDRTFSAVVRPKREDLAVRRGDSFPPLSATPRDGEGFEREERDEDNDEEEEDEEERAERAEAHEDGEDEDARRAPDSVTLSDAYGSLDASHPARDGPDIHVPRLPSKFVATFLWDLPRPPPQKIARDVRDVDGDANANANADANADASAEAARRKTREVYRRAADALRAAFLAAGVCDASSCEIRRDRHFRRAWPPLEGTFAGGVAADDDDDVRSLGPFYAVVRVRRWNDLELRDAVLASGRRAVSVGGFYEGEPVEIRVNADRDGDRERDRDRAAAARRLGRGFPGFGGSASRLGGSAAETSSDWRVAKSNGCGSWSGDGDAADSSDAESPGEDSSDTFGAGFGGGGGREPRRATLEGWRRTGRLQDTRIGRRPVHEGPCATCGRVPTRAESAPYRWTEGDIHATPRLTSLPSPARLVPVPVSRAGFVCQVPFRPVDGGSPPKCWECVVKSKAKAARAEERAGSGAFAA